ncbi:uncharacterized protein LOC116263271 [Nymphaea colorata]|nr:uncharacterized protein LOC116263271 [Nymphaea colorata]
MSFLTRHLPLLLWYSVFLFMGHCLAIEGRKRKYYPEEPPVKIIVVGIRSESPLLIDAFALCVTLNNGDVIDCVDFYSQPAMKHPSIRRNPQLRAELLPHRVKIMEDKTREPTHDNLEGIGPKMESCPPGSVPFLKATKAGSLNLSAINDFKGSSTQFFHKTKAIKVQKDKEEEHEYAVMMLEDGEYTGAEGTINIWAPIVHNRLEISVSQIWVVRNLGEEHIATLEAGWINNYGNWDVFVDDHLIGFWPSQNYDDGFPLANEIQWGGEIVNKRSRGRHTRTQMGSGHFSGEYIGVSAYITHMAFFDEHNRYSDAPTELRPIVDDPGCYDATYWAHNADYGSHMTMGGPGYDESNCP